MFVKETKIRGQFLPYFRCGTAKCRVMRSIRTTDPFFSYRDIEGQGRSNLSMRDALRLIYTFTNNSCQTVGKMKMTRQTILKYHSLCRRVCGI